MSTSAGVAVNGLVIKGFFVIISKVSFADLPCFTQSLMRARHLCLFDTTKEQTQQKCITSTDCRSLPKNNTNLLNDVIECYVYYYLTRVTFDYFKFRYISITPRVHGMGIFSASREYSRNTLFPLHRTDRRETLPRIYAPWRADEKRFIKDYTSLPCPVGYPQGKTASQEPSIVKPSHVRRTTGPRYRKYRDGNEKRLLRSNNNIISSQWL